MADYTFGDCLRNAYKVNWRIDDVLGGRSFDRERRWLPEALSGARGLDWLSEREARQLTQVELAAYAHLFSYVEEFIAPEVVELARPYEVDEREAFDALTNFAAEEVKHMNLFRQLRQRVDDTLGFETRLVGGERETAHFVLSKHPGAVLLLTAVIEWFTQRHFLEAIQDDAAVDPFTKAVFKAHWQEEAQHAKMDHIETVRLFARLSDAERDQAIDDLIQLVGAVDDLLQEQARLDLDNFVRHSGRDLSEQQQEDLFQSVLRAKRWTFIESGTTHPRFLELFLQVTTPEQQARVMRALEAVFASRPALAT